MRTRVSTVLVLLLVMPALMGCFGEDSKPPAKVEPPFGFDEHIASGVWYHIGGSPSNQNVTDILNGLKTHRVLERCEAILTGYLGAVAVGEAVLAVSREV